MTNFRVFIVALFLFSSICFSNRVSLLMGEADTHLAFVRNVLHSQHYYGNFPADRHHTSKYFSLLGQRFVSEVESHAILDSRGQADRQNIASAVRNIGQDFRVVLAPVGSAPGLDFNRLCRIYRNQPDFVFVVPAGNSRVNFDYHQIDMPHCQARNIIMVGSITPHGHFSGFSNYGQILRIAAVGEALWTETPYGNWAQVSGTGPAAAVVAARLAQFSRHYPELRGESLAAEFLWSESTPQFHLSSFVNQGRVLR